MNIENHLAFFLSVGSKIDALWNIFLAVHFAIISLYGGFRLKERGLLLFEKIFLAISYSLFVYINGNALIEYYQFLELAVSDVAQYIELGESISDMALFVGERDYTARKWLVISIYSSIYISIIIVLLFVIRTGRGTSTLEDS